MKILRQMFCGAYRKNHQDKNPTSRRVFILVHLCDLSWNQILPSLGLMHDKLVEMGFEYYNGKIVINEIETEGSNYHAK